MGSFLVVNLSCIDVLLPVYNGVKYLEEQVDSIFQQTLKPDRLLIRDDQSIDGSLELILNLSCRYGNWIKVIRDKERLGCKLSIAKLISLSNAKYLAFSDQDDIWVNTKLEVLLDRIHELEILYGTKSPLLVHTDLLLINDIGESLAITYTEKHRLDHTRNTLNELAFSNHITGCTVVVNRCLADLVLPMPKNVIIHDWWFALIASYCGVISFIDQPLVCYRQHGNNQIGAKGVSLVALVRKLFASKYLVYSDFLKANLQREYFSLRFNCPHSKVSTCLLRSRFYRINMLINNSALRKQLSHHGPLRNYLLIILFVLSPSQKNK